MGRPCKPDALSPAERARRYRLRHAGLAVTETVTEMAPVTEMVAWSGSERVAPRVCTEEEWPFPYSDAWRRKYNRWDEVAPP